MITALVMKELTWQSNYTISAQKFHYIEKPVNWHALQMRTGFKLVSLFHATGLFLHLLKTLEYQRFSNDFRGYWNGLVVWNRLPWGSLAYNFFIINIGFESKGHFSNSIIITCAKNTIITFHILLEHYLNINSVITIFLENKCNQDLIKS